MSRPRLLDLFCGAGGAAMGYHHAGSDVTGVDIKPQPHYPLPFILGDALEYVRVHGKEYDAIHASPPCQAYSIMRNLPWLKDRHYPKLIYPVRLLLNEAQRPWVIENVMGAKLSAGWLCGTMFNLPFFRHRFFEAGGWFWLQPCHRPHRNRIRPGHSLGGRARDIVFSPAEDNGLTLTQAQRVRDAMQIDWMTSDEITQAIPPAYTEWIGKQLLKVVRP